MELRGWAEIVLTIGVTVGLAWPLGIYLARVWKGERTWLDPVLKPVERLVYAGCGVKPEKGQGWFAYAMSFLAFSIASFVVLYLTLRFQIQSAAPKLRKFCLGLQKRGEDTRFQIVHRGKRNLKGKQA